MSCKASVSNLSAFVVLHDVGGPHAGHGFLVKAQRSAILWQVKYGCHSDDNSNITRVVKMSTRGVSVPFTRRYLFFWLHIRGKGTTGEPFRSINIVWDERISIFCQHFMYLSPLVRHSVFQDVSTRWKWIFDEESIRTSSNIFHENNVASCYTLKDLFCSERGNGLTFPARSVLWAYNLYLPFSIRRYFK